MNAIIVSMKIALIHEPTSSHGKIWRQWLIESKHEVTTIIDDGGLVDAEHDDSFDLVVPLITIKDYLKRPNARYSAAQTLQELGVPTLNSMSAIAASSDKWQSSSLWAKAGINQPRTYLLNESFSWLTDCSHMILKPRFGHSGENVYLVRSLSEAQGKSELIEGDSIIQEYIVEPICLRIIATPTEIISAYEKVLPGAVVVNIEKGATRKSFKVSENVLNTANRMVKALGGGLMGVDILVKDSEVYALEANVPFGFDDEDMDLRENLMSLIAHQAQ